ncbi:conserved hypothetical protein [Luminiphilus syltensis NOR5-1B]|uniref:Uncharacterized protein n=1 Tax=Luminiphilus syltensis NOR5-1B TaxID=565045 RepID=B8KUQ2_9GAMM|nr:hypothetical protein [Luminiphilus syltensis]EED35950.1 conserved hypothetical protein [Luminiphilus syltensis NOR5-1B]
MFSIPQRLQRLPLGHQLAWTAALCCLVATLLLVALAAQSSAHTQRALQDEFGQAVAQQLARRLSVELAAGDLLGVAAELQRLIEQPTIAGAQVFDVEDAIIGKAGNPLSKNAYSAAITIAGDIAGSIAVTIDTQIQDQARLQFIFGLSALSVILSIAVFLITRPLGSRLARHIDAVSAELAIAAGEGVDATNEVHKLRQQVAALPLELLKPSTGLAQGDEHYDDTGVLFIQLKSLPDYIDTLDEKRLQRYILLLHRLVYGAQGFYSGHLQVVRQFGLAVFFSGEHKVGSPALRATSCAWLIQNAIPAIEERLRLSLKMGLAVGMSELGHGDAEDIYPGLYTQATLDELQGLAQSLPDGISLSDKAASDIDVSTRVTVENTNNHGAVLGALADGHRDLLERQLQILLKAVLERRPEKVS